MEAARQMGSGLFVGVTALYFAAAPCSSAAANFHSAHRTPAMVLPFPARSLLFVGSAPWGVSMGGARCEGVCSVARGAKRAGLGAMRLGGGKKRVLTCIGQARSELLFMCTRMVPYLRLSARGQVRETVHLGVRGGGVL